MGPLTVSIGSLGKIIVPSGTDQISQVNLNSPRYFKKLSVNIFFSLKNSISSSSKLRFSIYLITASSPQAIANPPLSGIFLKNISKYTMVSSSPWCKYPLLIVS